MEETKYYKRNLIYHALSGIAKQRYELVLEAPQSHAASIFEHY
jgi:hypothetical protein